MTFLGIRWTRPYPPLAGCAQEQGRNVTSSSDKSPQERARKLHARIMAAHAFCSLAESQAHGKKTEEARESLLQIASAIDVVAGLLMERDHVSSSSAAELRELLLELQERAGKIEPLIEGDRER